MGGRLCRRPRFFASTLFTPRRIPKPNPLPPDEGTTILYQCSSESYEAGNPLPVYINKQSSLLDVRTPFQVLRSPYNCALRYELIPEVAAHHPDLLEMHKRIADQALLPLFVRDWIPDLNRRKIRMKGGLAFNLEYDDRYRSLALVVVSKNGAQLSRVDEPIRKALCSVIGGEEGGQKVAGGSPPHNPTPTVWRKTRVIFPNPGHLRRIRLPAGASRPPIEAGRNISNVVIEAEEQPDEYTSDEFDPPVQLDPNFNERSKSRGAARSPEQSKEERSKDALSPKENSKESSSPRSAASPRMNFIHAIPTEITLDKRPLLLSRDKIMLHVQKQLVQYEMQKYFGTPSLSPAGSPALSPAGSPRGGADGAVVAEKKSLLNLQAVERVDSGGGTPRSARSGAEGEKVDVKKLVCFQCDRLHDWEDVRGRNWKWCCQVRRSCSNPDPLHPDPLHPCWTRAGS